MGKVSPVEMFPCPLCGQSFPGDMIEIHASECVGGIESAEGRQNFLFPVYDCNLLLLKPGVPFLGYTQCRSK